MFTVDSDNTVSESNESNNSVSVTVIIPETTFTVVFDSQGGSSVPSTTSNANATITAPANPTRLGYTFNGWYKEPACTNLWNFSTDKVTSDMTLYAKWNTNTTDLPDLVPGSIKFDSSQLALGKMVVFSAEITNTGNVDTSGFITNWYVNGLSMWYQSHDGIPANSTIYNNDSFCYWSPPQAGLYTITYVVDCETQIMESNENNNSVSVSFYIPVRVNAVSRSYNSIDISWSTDFAASGYQVYRATSSAGSYSLIATTGSYHFVDIGLTTGRYYYYKVRPYIANGLTTTYRGFSSCVSAKPILTTPANLKVTKLNSKSIKLTWGAVAGATKYELYRATSKTGSYTLLTTKASLSFINYGLTTGKYYYYKVRAYRLVGTTKVYSGFSGVVSAKP
jgi:uncharacterized repeat protein (TIGR02543 family)